MSDNRTSMIATLGGQPQVVTFALDALQARGEAIHEVYVLHLSPQNLRTHQSLTRLAHEFVDDCYAGRPCRFRRVPITLRGQPILEIRNEVEADATWQTVRSLIAELKEQGHRLHLCVSGGRRMMSLMVMSAAMLLCDHQDRLWHLYTPEEMQERARDGVLLHAKPNDGVQLIQTPLAPWGTYFPALRAMATAPAQAVAQQMGWLQSANKAPCRQVYERLSLRQREILAAFTQGLSPQDVAAQLHITLSTVNSHKTAILAECRIAWGLDEEARLDYRFLRERFAGFLAQMGRV